MIDAISTVCIYVSDQDKAKQFYTEKLGFEVRTDQPMGPDARWLSVAPAGARTEIILYKMDENWSHYKEVVGKSQSITFSTPDAQSLYKTLKERGVETDGEPRSEPWGTYFMVYDQDHNGLLIGQQAD